jgi:multiple sugar transport system permease protein
MARPTFCGACWRTGPGPRSGRGRAARRRLGLACWPGSGGLALIFVHPPACAVLASFKPAAEGNVFPPGLWPSRVSLENDRSLLDFGDGVWRYLGNSAAVAGITVTGAVLLSLLAGYSCPRFRFPGQKVGFVDVLATLMIPFHSGGHQRLSTTLNR